MKDKLYNTLILTPFLWAFSGLLLLRNGDKLMIVAIVISIIVTLLKYGTRSIKDNIKDKGFWLVLVITAYAVFSYYYHGASSREMRALVGVTLLLLIFPRELINERVLKRLIFLGSVVLLASTYYFSLYLNLSRPQWPINAIPHATIGGVIVVLALILLINSHDYRDKIILGFVILLSIGAVIMNQTRGIWLALIIVFTIILLSKLKIKRINWKYTLITMIICSLGAYVAKPKLEQRIKETQAEIAMIQSGNLNSSIGFRFQLWALAPKFIEGHSILGSGNSHKDIFNALAQKGEVSTKLKRFAPAHYHNQYLDRLIKSGAIGLILLLLMLTYPLFFTQPGVNRQIAIVVVAIYALAGITDVPFNHGSTLFMYLLLIFTLNSKNDEASR